MLTRRPGTGAVLRRIEPQDPYCTATLEHFQPSNAERLSVLVPRLSLAALVLNSIVVEQFSVLPWAAATAQRERARTAAVELPPSAALAARLLHSHEKYLPVLFMLQFETALFVLLSLPQNQDAYKLEVLVCFCVC